MVSVPMIGIWFWRAQVAKKGESLQRCFSPDDRDLVLARIVSFPFALYKSRFSPDDRDLVLARRRGVGVRKIFLVFQSR